MTDAFANSTGSLPLGRLDFYQDDFLDQSEGDPRGRIRRPAMVLLVLAALSAFVGFVGQFGQIGTGSYEIGDAAIHVLLSLPSQAYDMMPVAVLIGVAAAGLALTLLRIDKVISA
jgi:hypothetical protein